MNPDPHTDDLTSPTTAAVTRSRSGSIPITCSTIVANIRKPLFSCGNWASASQGANRDGRTVMSHTPCGVDKLLIRPATETPSRRRGGVGHITAKTQRSECSRVTTPPLTPNPGGLYKAPPILTECSVHRFRSGDARESIQGRRRHSCQKKRAWLRCLAGWTPIAIVMSRR